MAPGFNKTVLVTLIDVAATERANREAPGSFFKHIGQTQTSGNTTNNSDPDPGDSQPRAVRTLPTAISQASVSAGLKPKRLTKSAVRNWAYLRSPNHGDDR
jgi:hypothetical protein